MSITANIKLPTDGYEDIILNVDLSKSVSIAVAAQNLNTSSIDKSVSATACNHPNTVSAFSLPATEIRPVEIGSWVGSIEKGANVNCNIITLCPHGSGTHTECVSHIIRDGPSIIDQAPKTLLPFLKLNVIPDKATEDTIEPNSAMKVGDLYISAQSIHKQMSTIIETLQQHQFPVDEVSMPNVFTMEEFLDSYTPKTLALIRSLSRAVAICTYTPQTYIYHKNSQIEAGKTPVTSMCPPLSTFHATHYSSSLISLSSHVDFSGTNPVYLAPSAATYIACVLDCYHLLVDLPSIDREDDGGCLLAHKAIFTHDLECTLTQQGLSGPSFTGSNSLSSLSISPRDLLHRRRTSVTMNSSMYARKTVTELCWFPLELHGTIVGVVDIQVAPINSDAAPSRPLVFNLLEMPSVVTDVNKN